MSERIECFKIDDKMLILDKVLVYFQEIPLIFICKEEENANNRYCALAVDTDNFLYLVVKVKVEDLIEYLEGNLSFVGLYNTNKKFYRIQASDYSLDEDIIEEVDSSLFKEHINYTEEVYFDNTPKDLKEYTENLKEITTVNK